MYNSNEDSLLPFSHILVIEDDKILSQLIQKILKREGYEVLSANDTSSAHKLLKDFPNCLLLLDYVLPDKQASEFICELKNNNTPCPFIIFTGHGDEKIAVNMMKLGAYDYIVKDSSFLEILATAIKKTERQLLTELKLERALQEIKHSEEKYRNIFNHIQDCYYETTLDGTILEVSPSISNISQYTREELIGKNMNSFYAESSARAKVIKGLTEKGYINDFEITLLDKNRNKTRCSITTKIIFKNSGNPHLIVGSMRNIDARVKAEEDLDKTTEKYKELYEASNDIIYTMDFQGNFTSISPSAEKILGYNLKELSKKNMADYISESHAKLAFDNITAKLKEEKKYSIYEVDFRNINGTFTTLEINSMIRYIEGEPYEVYGIARDITEKKKLMDDLKNSMDHLETMVAERTGDLKRSEELYRTTVNSFFDWVYVIDKDLNLISINQSLELFFKNHGRSGNFIEKNIRDVFDFLDEEAFDIINTAITTKKETIHESEYKVFGETYFTKRVISPVMQNNEIVRVVITVHDNTQVKKTEEDIRKTLEKEKELNMLKSRFISTVSHEFRTPLAGILSSVQLLKRYGNKWSEEKKEKMYKQIFDAVHHTKTLLDDVALIDKQQNKYFSFRPSSIDLQSLVKQIIAENTSLYNYDCKVNLKYNINDSSVYLDPTLIRHIFTNLVSNAIKYSGDNKQVNIAIRKNSNKEIEFVIADNGIGIPEEDQKHLFVAFHRASNVEGIQGTGFGLSVVKRFVDLHKGTISVESTLGIGTTVKVILPMNPDI